MYPELIGERAQHIKHNDHRVTVVPPLPMTAPGRSNGYTFDELMKMTPKEIKALKEATNDILAAVRQSKYNDIATILFLQKEIEKERV